MSETQTVIKSHCVLKTQPTYTRRTFADLDKKGRTIGGIVTLREVDMAPGEDQYGSYCNMEPGHYFTMTPQATRNGSGYGASQFTRYFKTEAERTAAVEKYFADAAKRAATAIQRRV